HATRMEKGNVAGLFYISMGKHCHSHRKRTRAPIRKAGRDQLVRLDERASGRNLHVAITRLAQRPKLQSTGRAWQRTTQHRIATLQTRPSGWRRLLRRLSAPSVRLLAPWSRIF